MLITVSTIAIYKGTVKC